jgi:hypothetical protein
MHRLAALVLLVPSLALAGGADVSEPDNLPPPKQPQGTETEPATSNTGAAASPLGSYRKSVTLEASVGAGYLISTGDFSGGFGLSGINFGVGGFLNNKLAITGRFVGVLSRGSDPTSLISIGGAVQYWLDDKLWIGGGAGLSYVYVTGANTNGFALDARAGYTFKQTREHAFHASLEVVPGFFDGGSIVGIAALVGYQYL